jgi:hypothetical protein
MRPVKLSDGFLTTATACLHVLSQKLRRHVRRRRRGLERLLILDIKAANGPKALAYDTALEYTEIADLIFDSGSTPDAIPQI